MHVKRKSQLINHPYCHLAYRPQYELEILYFGFNVSVKSKNMYWQFARGC